LVDYIIASINEKLNRFS